MKTYFLKNSAVSAENCVSVRFSLLSIHWLILELIDKCAHMSWEMELYKDPWSNRSNLGRTKGTSKRKRGQVLGNVSTKQPLDDLKSTSIQLNNLHHIFIQHQRWLVHTDHHPLHKDELATRVNKRLWTLGSAAGSKHGREKAPRTKHPLHSSEDTQNQPARQSAEKALDKRGQRVRPEKFTTPQACQCPPWWPHFHEFLHRAPVSVPCWLQPHFSSGGDMQDEREEVGLPWASTRILSGGRWLRWWWQWSWRGSASWGRSWPLRRRRPTRRRRSPRPAASPPRGGVCGAGGRTRAARSSGAPPGSSRSAAACPRTRAAGSGAGKRPRPASAAPGPRSPE